MFEAEKSWDCGMSVVVAAQPVGLAFLRQINVPNQEQRRISLQGSPYLGDDAYLGKSRNPSRPETFSQGRDVE